jgi:SAM-dependent methyltransferase
MDESNREQAAAWDGDEGSFWADHADRFDAAVSDYDGALMTAAGITSGDRVLDVGCGTGRTSREAARRASPGEVLGVDLSGRMLEVARQRARAEGLANLTFVQADAQVHPFDRGGFDVAISRTGTMFFGDPVAAFGNLASALRPDGRLAMAVWQPISENEWFTAVIGALAAGRTLPTPPPEAPSPFALADPDRVTRVLTTVGFDKPEFADVHAWMRLADLDAQGRGRALADLHATLQTHQEPDGVRLPSAMWIVTATLAV